MRKYLRIKAEGAKDADFSDWDIEVISNLSAPEVKRLLRKILVSADLRGGHES